MKKNNELKPYIVSLDLFLVCQISDLVAYKNSSNIINAGVFFGRILNNALVISLLIVIYLGALYFVNRMPKSDAIVVAVFWAGALSNILDRIVYGGVVDYIDLRIIPVFNLADVLIVGVVTIQCIRIIISKKA